MKTPEEERDHGTADDGQRAELLLARASLAQAQFWEALSDLEKELDVEIDGTRSLADLSIEDLTNE
jgi:hypothetical protein